MKAPIVLAFNALNTTLHAILLFTDKHSIREHGFEQLE
tara:strand:- start:283 stop:396 length:114 start_codon:yes stop_codon:yes gene_type:complete